MNEFDAQITALTRAHYEHSPNHRDGLGRLRQTWDWLAEKSPEAIEMHKATMRKAVRALQVEGYEIRRKGQS